LIHLAEFTSISYQIDEATYNKTALEPQNYSQIFVRAKDDLKINGEFKSGIYRLQGDNAGFDPIKEEKTQGAIYIDEQRDKTLIFQKNGYCINDLKESPGILILTQSKGRSIKKNDEFARIQINEGTYLENNEIKPWIIEVLNSVYKYQQ